MASLVLIRHSRPQPDPALPARQWALSPEGHRLCAPLATYLHRFTCPFIFTSDERKALDTAGHVAVSLGVPVVSDPALREHARENVPWLDQQAFEAAVRNLFVHRDELVFGEETATDAQARFAGSVGRALAASPNTDTFVVTHGIVMSLHVAAVTDSDPMSLWEGLGMPAVVVLNLATRQIVEQWNG